LWTKRRPCAPIVFGAKAALSFIRRSEESEGGAHCWPNSLWLKNPQSQIYNLKLNLCGLSVLSGKKLVVKKSVLIYVSRHAENQRERYNRSAAEMMVLRTNHICSTDLIENASPAG
jgi:hypothetical protein